MSITKQPTKEQVREWIHHRQLEHNPLPEMVQIRRELGWDIVQDADNCIPVCVGSR